VFEVDEVDSEEEVVDEDAVVDDRVLEEVEEVASVEDAVEEEEEDVDELVSSVDDSVIEEEVEGVVVEDEVSSPIAPAEKEKEKVIKIQGMEIVSNRGANVRGSSAGGSGRFKSAHTTSQSAYRWRTVQGRIACVKADLNLSWLSHAI
jgi:hypothetical protein